MSGRFILMAAGLLAGILIGIGGWLPACLLLLWLLVKTTRNLVIVVSLAILVGLGRGLIDAQQWRQPPVPQGSIVIASTFSGLTCVTLLDDKILTCITFSVDCHSSFHLTLG